MQQSDNQDSTKRRGINCDPYHPFYKPTSYPSEETQIQYKELKSYMKPKLNGSLTRPRSPLTLNLDPNLKTNPKSGSDSVISGGK